MLDDNDDDDDDFSQSDIQRLRSCLARRYIYHPLRFQLNSIHAGYMHLHRPHDCTRMCDVRLPVGCFALRVSPFHHLVSGGILLQYA